jgi:hypothetical protein
MSFTEASSIEIEPDVITFSAFLPGRPEQEIVHVISNITTRKMMDFK